MTLRLYTGEFLTSPVPLHLDMSYCSHGCFYCFANLGNPTRRLDASFLSPMIKALMADEDNGPLHHWLLRRGHPVLASNTVDVFARSNSDQFREIYEALTPLGVNFVYQTRGGYDSDLMAKCISGRRTMWYISLTGDNETKVRAAEPGSPAYGARMDLIRDLKAAGHHVIIGFNPMIPEHWDDFPGCVDELLGLGIAHAWFGPLHLSHLQVAQIPKRARERHADLISRSMAKSCPPAVMNKATEAYLAGMNIFSHGAGWDNGFWDAYYDLGFPWWPTLDAWFAELDEAGGGEPVVFSIDDLASFCDIGMPAPRSVYKDYVTTYGRSLRNAINAGETWREPHAKPRDMRGVIASYWQITDYPTILRQERLAIATTREDGELAIMDDGEGNDLMVYVPDGAGEEVMFDATEALRYVKGE